MKGSIADGITIKVGHGIITIPRETAIPDTTAGKRHEKILTEKPRPEEKESNSIVS